MGGKFRPAVMALSALAVLAMASPVAVLAGPLSAHRVEAATADAKHAPQGGKHGARNATSAPAPPGTPAADSDAATPLDGAPAEPAATPPAATAPAVATGSGHRSLPAQIELSKPRAGQPSERADHASASSRGLHLGAGDDSDEGAASTPTRTASPSTASPSTASSGMPSAGTLGASTPAAAKTSTNHPGGTSAPPSVIVAPPAAPQTNPPIATQPALTAARLDWILVGVVVALAAAVVAAVRVATLRGRRPQR